MDERVKLLAERTIGTNPKYAVAMIMSSSELQAFAELVIKECLAECWYDKTPLEISNSIRTKFGMPTVG